MYIKESVICEILDCGTLDLDYLVKLIDRNDIIVDELEFYDFWDIAINRRILPCLCWIAQNFLDEYQEEIEALNVTNHEYNWFVNSIDSHLWFEDEHLQALFETKGYYI